MASIVRQIEASVIAAMESVVGDAAKVSGLREAVAEGLVKFADSDGRPMVIVNVAPAASAGYSSPIIEFDVDVAVRLEFIDDPTISTFDEVAALVERKCLEWNDGDNMDAMTAALSTDNFRCDGFKLGGGFDTVPRNDERPYIQTTQKFTVKGGFLPDAATLD